MSLGAERGEHFYAIFTTLCSLNQSLHFISFSRGVQKNRPKSNDC